MRSRILALLALLAALGVALIGASPAHAAAPTKPVRVVDSAALKHGLTVAPGETVQVAVPAVEAASAVVPAGCISSWSGYAAAKNASGVVVDSTAAHFQVYFVYSSTGGSAGLDAAYYTNNSTHSETISLDRYDTPDQYQVYRGPGGTYPSGTGVNWSPSSPLWLFLSHSPAYRFYFNYADQPGTGNTSFRVLPCP